MQAKVLAAAPSKTGPEHWLVLVQLPLLARDQLPPSCSALPQAKNPQNPSWGDGQRLCSFLPFHKFWGYSSVPVLRDSVDWRCPAQSSHRLPSD